MMTHEQFLRQIVLLNMLPQALLTFAMRESVKVTQAAREELLHYLRQQAKFYRTHEADMQEEISDANASVLELQTTSA